MPRSAPAARGQIRGRTPRQRAREETIRRIKILALDQLAASGAGELSLRAIARELDVVSSAIYRYYPSRDDLLTDLIVDAYDDLADTLESATSGGAPRERWRAMCLALRTWARAQPHRFLLIYGTPVPGYRAPQATVGPAARVWRAIARPAVPAATSPAPDVPDVPDVLGTPGPSDRLTEQAAAAAEGLAVPPAAVLPAIAAAARLVGLLVLELGGHFVGTFEPADDLYAALVDRSAADLGL